ncbi:PqqD family protein [Listeria welshimeri]|uniref:PqqD family protein n=1 Tax=Listeria welshimeri TaxID=1643 RepID=A0A7X0W5Z3_LISWE|nr:PqqD family protein [Listeria welshimeri]
MNIKKNIFVTTRVLMDKNYIINGNSAYEMNDSATEIWSLLDTIPSKEALVTHLSQKYLLNDNKKNIRADIDKLFQYWEKEQLISLIK